MWRVICSTEIGAATRPAELSDALTKRESLCEYETAAGVARTATASNKPAFLISIEPPPIKVVGGSYSSLIIVIERRLLSEESYPALGMSVNAAAFLLRS